MDFGNGLDTKLHFIIAYKNNEFSFYILKHFINFFLADLCSNSLPISNSLPTETEIKSTILERIRDQYMLP